VGTKPHVSLSPSKYWQFVHGDVWPCISAYKKTALAPMLTGFSPVCKLGSPRGLGGKNPHLSTLSWWGFGLLFERCSPLFAPLFHRRLLFPEIFPHARNELNTSRPYWAVYHHLTLNFPDPSLPGRWIAFHARPRSSPTQNGRFHLLTPIQEYFDWILISHACTFRMPRRRRPREISRSFENPKNDTPRLCYSGGLELSRISSALVHLILRVIPV
jgi:hypothetical protein